MSLTPERLSGRRPFSVTASPYPSSCVSEEVEGFLSRYFPECFTVMHEQKCGGFIDISPHGLAYILKCIFFEVFGKSVISIVFNDSAEEYDLRMSFSSDEPISQSAEKDIRDMASDSGFWLVMGRLGRDNYISLKTQKRPAREFAVYARDFNLITQAFNSVFF